MHMYNASTPYVNTKKLISHRFSSAQESIPIPHCGVSAHTYTCPGCNYGKLDTISCRKSIIIMYNRAASSVIVCEHVDYSQIFVTVKINTNTLRCYCCLVFQRVRSESRLYIMFWFIHQ